VLVSVLNILVVDMWVSVGLRIVTVFVLMFDVRMIVQDVRMGVRDVVVCVLMGVLCCGHGFPVLDDIALESSVRQIYSAPR